MSNDTNLDLAAVDTYLSAHLSGYKGPLEATKFTVGQSNPTFELRSPEAAYVLRRKPPGVLLKSAHAVDREFRVQRALSGSQVPVPEMFLLCEDDTVIGSAFYVMERLHGRVFPEPTLQGESNETRTAVLNEMNRVLAGLHMVDIDAVGLSDFGPAGNYYERQISRWTKQYRASETSVIEDMDALASELESSVPADDGQRTLVHGDYRIDNLMFAPDGTDCIGVLDWELSTIGHPYADLAAVIMQWQLPPGKQGRGLAGIDRASLGLPSDQDFVAQYCKRRSLPGIDNFGFYLAFNFFRMAGILQGVYKRALDGNASDPERAKAYGAYVPLFARHGLEALRSTFN
ncbi:MULTISPECIES: phosphotransferase [unclassified Ruegeria]|uniref:phosphotransferase n=1 Tax=unclassified Ruegeria TaxID=2625375 RepID=UPI001487DF10|nr:MULTISPECIES: phosphotransferase [unclassified Ruegeria]NOD75425.1 phosphotransferase [Ruegeria sp. HKCCD4332]NOD87386.1 phosphotransferase [Ruegeria sp. HKCCD4318]NOE12941.1 phosphotransferase [Ruegeria sp. HKCCD4318-2]NOG08892.1 phosphotransferase [Ruegeria sp. HKCCD4315]